MNGPEALAAVGVVVAVGVTVTSIVRAVVGARAGGAGRGRLADADARLARIEQAVDAMAVEVERISEGQRFTTRLLAERAADAQPAARAAGADTRRGGGL